jgi:hypothetical protein
MRVLAAGANPLTATFNDLLFDANNRAMRQIQASVFACTLPVPNATAIDFVSLAKTFSSPPLAVGMIEFTTPGLSGVRLPGMSWPTISGNPAPSGAIIGTDTSRCFCENAFANTVNTGLTASIMVFDFPMAG